MADSCKHEDTYEVNDAKYTYTKCHDCGATIRTRPNDW